MSLVENALSRMRQAARPQQVATGGSRADSGNAVAGGRIGAPQSQGGGRTVVLNHGALRAAGMLPPPSQERHIARQYRQIKRPLVSAVLGRGVPAVEDGRVILVTSALPGEGKTFTSLNLSLSLALEQDLAVVLVDADVPKPHITEQLGLKDDKGLLDALVDANQDVESLILPTDSPGLSVLPVGRSTPNAAELLTSARMLEVLRTIAGPASGRVAVLDSSPVLLTSEAPALAELAGQIVMVVRAGHTSRQDVLDALGLVNARANVSLVLNQSVAGDSQDYKYGYGAGHAETMQGSAGRP